MGKLVQGIQEQLIAAVGQVPWLWGDGRDGPRCPLCRQAPKVSSSSEGDEEPREEDMWSSQAGMSGFPSRHVRARREEEREDWTGEMRAEVEGRKRDGAPMLGPRK